MRLKVIFAFFAGAAGFFACTAVVWLYLSMRVLNEGISPPKIVSDRAAAILFSLAFGSALSCGAFIYMRIRELSGRPLRKLFKFIFTMIIPFFGTFALLFIAHSQLPSMQFSDSGKPFSPWGYLFICGLPVVVGIFIGAKIEDWFPLLKDSNDK